MDQTYLSLGIMAIGYILAAKINIALIAQLCSIFAIYTLSGLLQHQLSIELLLQLQVLIMSSSALTALLLLVRRWPSLWVLQSMQIVLFGMSAFLFDEKIATFGIYLLLGSLLPTLYALRKHESIFHSSMVEMAFMSPLTIGGTCFVLLNDWFAANPLTFKGISKLLNWLYFIPLSQSLVIAVVLAVIALMAFLCAELMLYCAPEENNPIRRAHLSSAALLIACAVIQPISVTGVAYLMIIACVLIGHYKLHVPDRRGLFYTLLSIILTLLIITPTSTNKFCQTYKSWIEKVVKQPNT